MVRSFGAQLGLLAFASAIVAGLYAGNSPTTILLRALLVMVFACLTGQAAGWAGKLVLRDHLQRRKLKLDREHCEAIAAAREEPIETESPAQVEGG